MRVVLFRSLSGQISMENYARELLRALQALGDPGLALRLWPEEALSPPRGFAGRAAYGLQKYLWRQGGACFVRGEVHHVLDHSSAHLVYSLPAERTAVTVHDLALLHPEVREGTWSTRAAFRISLRALRRAARLVADSHFAREEILKYLDLPAARVRVVYSGVGPEFRMLPPESRRTLRARYGLPEGCYFLHVGLSVRRKNLETLLRALALLDKKLPRACYLLKVGAPLTPQQRRLAAELGLERRIREMGKVSRAELVEFYNLADGLVFPSIYEGFGWPVLEAMACGLPVAAANAASLPEVVGGAGLLFDPQNPQELAALLGRLVTDEKERAELIRRGLSRAAEFAWEKTARAFSELYQELASNQGKRP